MRADAVLVTLGALTFLSVATLLITVTFTEPSPGRVRLVGVCALVTVLCLTLWFIAAALVITGVLS